MQQFHYIKEVLVYLENKSIVAEFFLDLEEYPDAKERLEGDVRGFNKSMPMWKRINTVRTRDEEFPKTTSLKIKRNYDMIAKN